MTADLVVPTRRVASAPRAQVGRIVVIDALRGIALLGMLVAHANPLLPPGVPRPVGFVMGQFNDIASPLFALAMGISAQLLLSRTPRPCLVTGRYRWPSRQRVAARDSG